MNWNRFLLICEGCSSPLLTNHFTACLLPAKPDTIRGTRPCSAFLESMSGTSVRIRLMTSVSTIHAEKHITLYPLLFLQVVDTSFSINHCTARQLPFTARIITGEIFSALHDSMLGTWVKIRAMISGLLPNAAGCYEFHPPLFIRHRSAPLFIKPLNSWTLPFTAAFFCSVLTFASLVSTENRGEMLPNIIIWTEIWKKGTKIIMITKTFWQGK